MADNEELNLGRDNAGQPGAPSRGKGRLWIIVAVAGVVLAGGAGAFFLLPKKGGTPPAAEAPAAAEAAGEPIYLGMDPFVVNFDHRGSIRYLQVELEVMARREETIGTVRHNMPAVRNRLIMLFSGQDFDVLRTVEGKEALRQAVLEAVNDVIGLSGRDRVEEAFFTGFVLQ